MPVTGLPVILDASLNSLMQESTLSSFKIFINDNGTSTVVVHFTDTNHLARQLPSYPPRPKSQSRLRRDKERCEKFYYNKNKQSAAMHSSTPCRPKPTLQSTTRVFSNSASLSGSPDDNNVYGRTQQTLSTTREVVHTTLSEYPTTMCGNVNHTVNVGSDHVEDSVPNSPLQLPSNCNRDFHLLTPTPLPRKETIQHISLQHTTEHNEDSGLDDSAILLSTEDLDSLIASRDNMSQDMRNRVHDMDRNTEIIRVAEHHSFPDPHRGLALIVETDDLFVTYFPQSRAVGPVYIFQDPDADTMLGKDKVQYDWYYGLQSYKPDSGEKEDLSRALEVALKYMRDPDTNP